VSKALNAALKIRQAAARKLWEPICIYDFVEEHKVEIRFWDVPSMEGMYIKKSGPIILISSLRPPGRQAFTCAHEFGHHVFNHGSHVDELNANSDLSKPEEFLADCFAGFLLMPKLAVNHAFSSRDWNLKSPTPAQLYTIAGYFGVGYSTLIDHMRYSLGLLTSSLADAFIKIHPKDIRAEILDEESKTNLVIADSHWNGRPIDIQVGDIILVPSETIHEGNCVRQVREIQTGTLFEGITSGVGRFYNVASNWFASVRVARQAYIGRCKYRHFEEI
jgi:Zn-dependent peptidase ImmA (M78 family)